MASNPCAGTEERDLIVDPVTETGAGRHPDAAATVGRQSVRPPGAQGRRQGRRRRDAVVPREHAFRAGDQQLPTVGPQRVDRHVGERRHLDRDEATVVPACRAAIGADEKAAVVDADRPTSLGRQPVEPAEAARAVAVESQHAGVGAGPDDAVVIDHEVVDVGSLELATGRAIDNSTERAGRRVEKTDAGAGGRGGSAGESSRYAGSSGHGGDGGGGLYIEAGGRLIVATEGSISANGTQGDHGGDARSVEDDNVHSRHDGEDGEGFEDEIGTVASGGLAGGAGYEPGSGHGGGSVSAAVLAPTSYRQMQLADP